MTISNRTSSVTLRGTDDRPKRGPGRPPKGDDVRRHAIRVLVSDAEFEVLTKWVRRRGGSLSARLRDVGLGAAKRTP